MYIELALCGLPKALSGDWGKEVDWLKGAAATGSIYSVGE